MQVKIKITHIEEFKKLFYEWLQGNGTIEDYKPVNITSPNVDTMKLVLNVLVAMSSRN